MIDVVRWRSMDIEMAIEGQCSCSRKRCCAMEMEEVNDAPLALREPLPWRQTIEMG